ncbi:MAG: hypothetical protein ACP5ER_01530 [Candidatus Bathyarchaeales archaeon]
MKVSVAYAFTLTYLSAQCKGVVSQRVLKAKTVEYLSVVCHWRFALWSVVGILGMGNVKTRILKSISSLKEGNCLFVGVAGAK